MSDSFWRGWLLGVIGATVVGTALLVLAILEWLA